jgi:hypothetical protein
MAADSRAGLQHAYGHLPEVAYFPLTTRVGCYHSTYWVIRKRWKVVEITAYQLLPYGVWLLPVSTGRARHGLLLYRARRNHHSLPEPGRHRVSICVQFRLCPLGYGSFCCISTNSRFDQLHRGFEWVIPLPHPW